MAGIEKAPLRGDRSDPHLIRIAPQQQTAHTMEAVELEIGHRAHAEMVVKPLNQTAAAGMGLAAEIGQGDGLLGVVIEPALGSLDDLDARRRTRQVAELIGTMDQGFQEQRDQILQNQTLAGGPLQTPRIVQRQGEDLTQIGTQDLAAQRINRKHVAAQSPLLIQAPATHSLSPVAERLAREDHQAQHHIPGQGEVNVPFAVQAEKTGGRQGMAMGPQGRTPSAGLEVEADRDLIRRLGPPAMDPPVQPKLQQPQWPDPDRQPPAGKVAAFELEQLQRQAKPVQHRLQLLHTRPAQGRQGGALRPAGAGRIGPLPHRVRRGKVLRFLSMTTHSPSAQWLNKPWTVHLPATQITNARSQTKVTNTIKLSSHSPGSPPENAIRFSPCLPASQQRLRSIHAPSSSLPVQS